MSGSGVIKIVFVIGCAVLFGLLYLGAWVLRKALPASHPLQNRLSASGVLYAAKILAALLIAAYFLGALILYS